tara:strand:+ start:91 stop:258 length:168 start_codon:yes stop_codon:yes gene_type:complete
MIEQLLNDLKKMREDMVAKNYPFQQLSNLIVKYETMLNDQKTPSEKLQDDLEPIE